MQRPCSAKLSRVLVGLTCICCKLTVRVVIKRRPRRAVYVHVSKTATKRSLCEQKLTFSL